MFEALAAVAVAVVIAWLFRRTRPATDEPAPDGELWGAFDRGEDPTSGPPYGTI